jgi:hypothetical protein
MFWVLVDIDMFVLLLPNTRCSSMLVALVVLAPASYERKLKKTNRSQSQPAVI